MPKVQIGTCKGDALALDCENRICKSRGGQQKQLLGRVSVVRTTGSYNLRRGTQSIGDIPSKFSPLTAADLEKDPVTFNEAREAVIAFLKGYGGCRPRHQL